MINSVFRHVLVFVSFAFGIVPCTSQIIKNEEDAIQLARKTVSAFNSEYSLDNLQVDVFRSGNGDPIRYCVNSNQGYFSIAFDSEGRLTGWLDSYADEQRIKSKVTTLLIKDEAVAWKKGDAFLDLHAVAREEYVRGTITNHSGNSSPSARVNGGDLFILRYERPVPGFEGFIGTITIQLSALDGNVMMFSRADYKFDVPAKTLSRDEAVPIMRNLYSLARSSYEGFDWPGDEFAQSNLKLKVMQGFQACLGSQRGQILENEHKACAVWVMGKDSGIAIDAESGEPVQVYVTKRSAPVPRKGSSIKPGSISLPNPTQVGSVVVMAVIVPSVIIASRKLRAKK